MGGAEAVKNGHRARLSTLPGSARPANNKVASLRERLVVRSEPEPRIDDLSEPFGSISGVHPILREMTAPPESARRLEALVAAGLLRALDTRTTLALLGQASSIIDLLSNYYAIDRGRRLDDRFLLCGRGGARSVHEIAAALSELAPEMHELRVERIGDATEGQLVLTSGEDLRPILDDEDDGNVSVDAVVHAFNGFLRETNTTTRLVPIASDDDRTIYVGLPLARAVDLLEAGLLELEDSTELVEFGDW